jgi:hypothetical protein
MCTLYCSYFVFSVLQVSIHLTITSGVPAVKLLVW